MARKRAKASAPGQSQTSENFSGAEETARQIDDDNIVNVMILKDGVGGSDITAEKLSVLSDDTNTIVVEVEKRLRASPATGVAHDSETIMSCPQGGGLKMDATSKTMTGDPGVVNFEFGPMDGVRGIWTVEFVGGLLGRRLLHIEFT